MNDDLAAEAYRLEQAKRMIAAWEEHCAVEGIDPAIDLADPEQAAEFARVWRARLEADRKGVGDGGA